MPFKKISFPIIVLFISSFSFAQNLTTIADGGNKKASVSERIGITDVTIHYDRPAVKDAKEKFGANWYTRGLLTLDLVPAKLRLGGQARMKTQPSLLVQMF